MTRTPTESPSDVPSSTPSSPESNTVRQLFQQEFLVPLVNGSAFFTINETVVIGDLYASYTPRFAPESVGLVFSECIANFQTQRVFNVPNSTNTSTNILEYTCGYLSRFVNVSTYPQLFLEYVNGNLDTVTSDLQNLEVNVIRAENTQAVQVLETPAPTPLGPTIPPSTLSPYPSPMPSGVPTALGPTASPTEDKIPEITPQPTPGDNRGDGFPVPAIAAIVVVAGIAILLGLAFFFRQRLKKRQASSPRNRRHGGNDVFVRRKDVQSDVGIGMPPSGSIMSDKSLVSEGGSGLGGASDDEMDGTKNLQDEFDQYKDQNLEQLRSDVEGNLAGFEGIMSAAVTKALMGDEDSKIDHRELMWGCHGNPTGAEVEASALCDVNDWLKRNELAPVERKRAFMQDMLNKMVASVRFGVLHAEDASRTIHESAALLGLQLANELPMTTVIISGMRKTVKAAQFVKVLEEFGEIDVAAVASGERGFGIVRFRHPKSVERAMRRYRNAEIVVEDVAVQLKVITPSGEVLSRA